MPIEDRKNALNQKREGLEHVPESDFKRIFLEKLEAIETIPEEEREDSASGYEAIGIKKLKREVPAILITTSKDKKSKQFDLWITNPKEISDNSQPHDEVREDFTRFLNISKFSPEFTKYFIGALFLQDEEEQFYLLVDEIRARGLNTHLQIEEQRLRFFNFLQRYDIKKVAGRFWGTWQEGDTEVSGGKTRTILNQDFLGEKREDLQLLNIALKFKMTNTQFMRFRIRAKSSIDAVKQDKVKEEGFILGSLEKIAQEVINEDKE